jgi:hypothetical protein
VIIAQPFRDVGIENFVDDYFSVEKSKKAYTRRVEPLGDQSFWPQVGLEDEVCAPLLKRSVGRQRKNRIKGCLEGGSGKKTSENETEKAKKLVRGKFKCPNCGELGHRKNIPKVPPKWNKENVSVSYKTLMPFLSIAAYVIPFFMCRKRKPRKNTTNGWFLKEASTSSPQPPSTSSPPSPPYEDVGAASPPSPPYEDVGASSSPSPPYEDVGASLPSSPPRNQKNGCSQKADPEEEDWRIGASLLCGGVC